MYTLKVNYEFNDGTVIKRIYEGEDTFRLMEKAKEMENIICDSVSFEFTDDKGETYGDKCGKCEEVAMALAR